MSLPGYVAGTAIATADGPKPIQYVKAGDRILSLNGWRRVLVADQAEGRAVSIRCSDGRVFEGDMNALAFSKGRGWIPLARLYDGDVLSCSDSTSIGVASVIESKVGMLFSLLVSKTSGFFGAGVLLR